MTDDYLDAFVRESEESITELNNSLLALESDPDDEAAMDRVFRTAHTLKGNFGAMGFAGASDLAHAIEDLLDAIREGDLDATPAVMDEVFEGVDRIETILDEIEADGEPSTPVDDRVTAIRATLEEGADAATADPDGADDGQAHPGEGPAEIAEDSGETTDDPVGAAADPPAEESDAGATVHVEMADTEMPGVDAMLALETAENDVAIRKTDPPRDRVEEGSFDDGFAVVVEGDAAAAADALASTRQIASATPVAEGAGPASGGDGAPPTAGDRAAETAPDAGTDASAGDGTDDAPAEETDATAAEETPAEADGDTAERDEGGAPESGADGNTTESDDGDTTERGDDAATDDIKSVRVDVDQLDDLYGLVEQLVTSRIKLRRAVETASEGSATENLDELDKITTSLQNTVMDMRLIPVKRAVNTFPRLVRDLARDLDKRVDLRMEGTDVELDRTILDEISDPLMHVIRNAVDHGVEPPAVREEKGKPPTGTVRLRAERERDSVTITVEDDGAGLDPEEIRAEAIEQGIRDPTEMEAMDDSDVYDLVYHPGFSTSDEVTDVSGRGVGMDVVHETVTRLDGDVSVESAPDEGTTVTLELPVSMAIVKVLFVTVGGREYGIPIKNIEEVSRDVGVETIRGKEVVSHGDDAYPVIDLDEALETDRLDAAEGRAAAADGGRTEEMYVRVRESVRRVVLRCGRVTQQEEVVIKPFQGQLSDTRGLSGTAVIGDGKVVPIIDVTTL
jgi:two-component system chemotaxis sensor kinase CheA